MSLTDLLHYLRIGGVTLSVLLGCSVLALIVAVERILALWNVSASARDLSDSVSKHLLRGDIPAARSAAERSESVVADLFVAGFERASRTSGPALQTAVDRERAQVGLRMKRNLWVLGTIGATAPFVGLFGTVVGIMRAFKDLGVDVQGGGTGGSAAVMTGISEALIVTAVGIFVAVEAVVLYNYFQARLGRVNVEVRLMAEEFIELLRERAAVAPAVVPVVDDPPAAQGKGS